MPVGITNSNKIDEWISLIACLLSQANPNGKYNR